jgi:AraC family transcriptional activator of pobA
MSKILSLRELVYPNKDCYGEYLLLSEANHFNVFHRSEICDQIRPVHRSDFYKISLIKGKGVLQVRDKCFEINGNVLVFYNPTVPYCWEFLSEETPSYYCYFDAHFQSKLLNKDCVLQSPLFNPQMSPICVLNEEQAEDLRFVFNRMCREIKTDYHHKYDTLATYLQLLIQEGFKFFNTSERTSTNKSGATRIVSAFLNLLERQFPVDSVEHPLKLKAPGNFAQQLSVHVNHLNYAVKELTGKQTSDIISSRVITEAKALLEHSHIDIAQIGYMLGFEYPSSFITFFKRHSAQTPRAFRKSKNFGSRFI